MLDRLKSGLKSRIKGVVEDIRGRRVGEVDAYVPQARPTPAAPPQPGAPVATADVEAKRVAAERAAAEAAAKAESERAAAAKAAEAAAKAESERAAAAKAAEAAAKAESERAAAAKAAEAAAKAESERAAAAKAAEAAAKAESERVAAEAAAKAESERVAAEAAAKAESERVAAANAANAAAKPEEAAPKPVAPAPEPKSSVAALAAAAAAGKLTNRALHADTGSTDIDAYLARARANGRDVATVTGGVGLNTADDGVAYWGPVDNESSRAKAAGKLLAIDQFECISCGTCVEQTDKVYVLPADGKASPIAQDGPMDLIQDAIDACPVTCISWVTPEEAEERGLATGVDGGGG
jgi:ferredoxin